MIRLRGFVAVAALTSSFLVGSQAHAQQADQYYRWKRHDRPMYESPQLFAVELRFGPYIPNIDEEFNGGAKPYESTFGSGKGFHFGVEVDYAPASRCTGPACASRPTWARSRSRPTATSSSPTTATRAPAATRAPSASCTRPTSAGRSSCASAAATWPTRTSPPPTTACCGSP